MLCFALRDVVRMHVALVETPDCAPALKPRYPRAPPFRTHESLCALDGGVPCAARCHRCGGKSWRTGEENVAHEQLVAPSAAALQLEPELLVVKLPGGEDSGWALDDRLHVFLIPHEPGALRFEGSGKDDLVLQVVREGGREKAEQKGG